MRSAPIHKFKAFESREQADAALAVHLASSLNAAIQRRGQANAMLSGGSTPGKAYRALSEMEVAWDKVRIGLVDDRWVDEDDPGSNAAMIRRTLLRGKAAGADLLTLKTDHLLPADGQGIVEARLSTFHTPFDVCVMGMGTDGHTASWFPGSTGLESALDIANPDLVCAIDAGDAPVAGAYRHRLSLTLTAVMKAREIILYITGAEKRRVFQAAEQTSVQSHPVKALLAAGPRLMVYWAP